MKIAFVTPEFVTESNSFDGGLSNYLLRTCLALKEAGHEPVVIVWSIADAAEMEHMGIKVYRVLANEDLWWKVQTKFLSYDIEAAHWLLVSRQLNKELKELDKQYDFDIVQYASYRAVGYYNYRGKPTVVRLSGWQELIDKAMASGASLSPRQKLCHKLERQAMLRADYLFAPSKLIQGIAQTELGKSVELIESPFTLADVPLLDKSVYERELQSKNYLLFLGTISRLKGVDLIIDALEQLLPQNPEILICLVGKVVPDMEPSLKAALAKYQRNLIWIDRLPHNQLYPIVQNAYAVLLPSRIDNLPNTCLEAMALGKVVLGAEGASFEQMINDGENGLLFKVGDLVSFTANIRKLLTLPKFELGEMGEKAAQTVLRLKPELVTTQLVKYYQKVIQTS